MKNRSVIRWFTLLVFVLPAMAWLLISWYDNRVSRLPVLGPTGHRIEEFRLPNQDSVLVSDKDFAGKLLVANFFFSHCPVVCPKMTAQLKRIDSLYRNDNTIQIVSFSVDPERDTPARLRQYIQQFRLQTQRWDLLTGDKKLIYRLARNSFKLVASEGDGGPADFIHSDRLVLIDRQRRIRGYYNGTSEKEVNQLAKDIKTLQHEK